DQHGGLPAAGHIAFRLACAQATWASPPTPAVSVASSSSSCFPLSEQFWPVVNELPDFAGDRFRMALDEFARVPDFVLEINQMLVQILGYVVGRHRVVVVVGL